MTQGRLRNFVNGRYTDPCEGAYSEVIDPSTGHPRSVGKATWTIVTSTSNMNVAPQTAISVHQRRSSLGLARGSITAA